MTRVRPWTWLLLALVGLAGLVDAVVLPIGAKLAAAEQATADARKTYEWVANAVASQSLRSSGTGARQPVSIQVLEQSLNREALRAHVTRMERTDRGLVIDFENAPFDGVVRWIALLDFELRARVNSLRLAGSNAPGRVGGSVVVEADPGT